MVANQTRSAVITGAGSGLGRELALLLAADGWRVLVTDCNRAEAKKTLQLIEEAGGSGEAYRLNVNDASEVEAVADLYFEKWGRVDLLVNNAGVAVAGFVGDIALKDWNWIYGPNMRGTVHGCHSFIPRMKAQGGGHILNIASAAGFASLPEMAPYNLTKAAVISLSETLYAELAPDNIGITVACPNFFNTNLLQTMRYTEQFQYEFARTAFTNSRMSGSDVAGVILKAVRRGKLYCLPMFSGRILWLLKRLSPQLYFRVMARLCRKGKARPLIMNLARRGLA
ncbi:MAG: SDR family NAD(P)-dependent oxidoreductase [Firmicutes bacterium]|nr:SDR family NAD(P)-dependent oxidoreductase [Bacillota bacterium]